MTAAYAAWFVTGFATGAGMAGLGATVAVMTACRADRSAWYWECVRRDLFNPTRGVR